MRADLRRPAGATTLWPNLLLISGTWGSSFLFAKLITQSLPPFAFAAARGGIAMAALLVWLALRRRAAPFGGARPRAGRWKLLCPMLVLGTTNGWLVNVLTATAVSRVDTGIAAMLQATVPLIVAVLAHLIFAEERFRAAQLVGIVAGFAGILSILGPVAVFGGHGSLVGVGAMLLAALSYASGTVYARHVAAKDPAVLACGQQACGAVIAAAISATIEPASLLAQPARIWLLLVVIGVVCSALPTVLYLRLLARAPSVPASLVAYLQPVWATLLGCLCLGEAVAGRTLLGAGLVVVAIAIAARPPAARRVTDSRPRAPRPLPLAVGAGGLPLR